MPNTRPSGRDITSVLTLLGGEVVHADGDFKDLAPPLPPPAPDWSPVRYDGDYQPRSGSQKVTLVASSEDYVQIGS
jgi:hypothetical protein